MIDLSQRTLVWLWTELDDAYYGKNNFGGHIAEIYCDHIMQDNSAKTLSGQAKIAADLKKHHQTAENLYALLSLFLEMRDCDIQIGMRPFGIWLKEMGIEGRIYICVTPKG